MTAVTDIKLITENGRDFDIQLSSTGDLIADTGYNNALLVSFGTDARALPNQVPNSENRRGWWGNQFNQTLINDIGSQLWILETRAKNKANLNEGEALIKQAFNWLVEEGRATRIVVKGKELSQGYSFEIKLLNGNDVIESRTFELWVATSGNRSIDN